NICNPIANHKSIVTFSNAPTFTAHGTADHPHPDTRQWFFLHVRNLSRLCAEGATGSRVAKKKPWRKHSAGAKGSAWSLPLHCADWDHARRVADGYLQW